LFGNVARPSQQKVASATTAKSREPKTTSPSQARAEIHWEGDSNDVLRRWPKPIRIDFGVALNAMQEGRSATLEVRPMPSVGKGVFELKTDDEATWYRLMYLARINNVIYVLDCFEKDSRKAERKDIAVSEKRYKQVQERLREERKNAKRKGSEQAKPRHKG
jgi:phage-related protein